MIYTYSFFLQSSFGSHGGLEWLLEAIAIFIQQEKDDCCLDFKSEELFWEISGKLSLAWIVLTLLTIRILCADWLGPEFLKQ